MKRSSLISLSLTIGALLLSPASTWAQTITPLIRRPIAVLPLQVSVQQAASQAMPVQEVAPAALAQATISTRLAQRAACFPASPVLATGLLPPDVSENSRLLPSFQWPQSQPGLNYIVERAVYGANIWSLVGSTCGGTPSLLASSGPNPGDPVRFIDNSGTLTPATTYVYKITAISPSNQTAWISFRWTSATSFPTPSIDQLTHNGSTVSFSLGVRTAAGLGPVQITGSWGYSAPVPLNGPNCRVVTAAAVGLVGCSIQLPAPLGNDLITATVRWGYTWDGTFHTLGQSSTSAVIDVQVQ